MSGGLELSSIPARYKQAIAGVLLVLILGYYADWWVHWRSRFGIAPTDLQSGPVENGILLVIVVWLAYIAATGHVSIWMVVNGFDGRASTSKFQPFLWTILVVWAYVAVLTALWQVLPGAAMPEIPGNVLIALGITFGTAAIAKVVTNTKVTDGTVEKTETSNAGPGPLFQDDKGRPDLYKIQTLAFTFIAAAAFVVAVLGLIPKMSALVQEQLDNPEVVPADVSVPLPDISDGLMALMGIGSAAYLTKKVTDTKATFLTSLSVDTVSLASDAPQRTVIVKGMNFGTTQGATNVFIDDIQLQTPITDWTDTSFSLVIPTAPPGTSQWRQVTPLELKVTGSVNALLLVITP